MENFLITLDLIEQFSKITSKADTLIEKQKTANGKNMLENDVLL